MELSPSADLDNNKSFFTDDHSETKIVTEEPSDSSDIHKSSIDFDTGKNVASNVPAIRKSGPSSARSSGISPEPDTFDTCNARDGSSAFDNYEQIKLGDSDDFDTSGPLSSFDISKPTSIDDDELDNYKTKSAQSFSFDEASGSSPFIGFEQSKPCRASNFDIFI